MTIKESDFNINPKLKEVYTAVSLLNEFDQNRLVKKFIIDLAENGDPITATQAVYLATEIGKI